MFYKNSPIDILYIDNHLLVVDKPAGLATQPSPTSDESLELICKNWLKTEFQKPGNVYLHALHRLDKPVSGIVLFARTSKALSRLNQAMRDKKMKKIYIALVEGYISPSEGTLEHYLIHGDHIAHLANSFSDGAKKARLHYLVKSKDKKTSLVEISLDTGRYHQIRTQMAAIRHPIIGDIKYGSKIALPTGNIALCHAHFCFPHPISNEEIKLNLKTPPHWTMK